MDKAQWKAEDMQMETTFRHGVGEYCWQSSRSIVSGPYRRVFPTVKSASQTLFGSSVFSLWQSGTRPWLLLTRASKGSLREMKKYQRRPLAAAFTPTPFVTVIDFDFENANVLQRLSFCTQDKLSHRERRRRRVVVVVGRGQSEGWLTV